MTDRRCTVGTNEWVSIPLLGAVAAGEPLEVFSVEESVDVPQTLWNGRRVYALRVRGQSMVDAGIHDGDYIIVEPCETADHGRTVVAEIDGKVTVKKLYREAGGNVRLQPANPNVLPFVVRGDRVRIRGVVVGILRKYGFAARKQRAAMPAPEPVRIQPGETMDHAIQAIDQRLERWRRQQRELRRKGAEPRDLRIARAGRELQALRDWCARTEKPRLQRALIDAAAKLMQDLDELGDRDALFAEGRAPARP